jgi:hypothetical protein
MKSPSFVRPGNGIPFAKGTPTLMVSTILWISKSHLYF